MLHFSCAAICSTLVTVPAKISSSRPTTRDRCDERGAGLARTDVSWSPENSPQSAGVSAAKCRAGGSAASRGRDSVDFGSGLWALQTRSCDNVFVPWENVFIYRNLAISRDQWWKTPAHLYGNHQAQCRYATKLRFMIGLAKRMNEITGNDAHPAVNVEMGAPPRW